MRRFEAGPTYYEGWEIRDQAQSQTFNGPHLAIGGTTPSSGAWYSITATVDASGSQLVVRNEIGQEVASISAPAGSETFAAGQPFHVAIYATECRMETRQLTLSATGWNCG